jgi:hypothetical protein
MIDGQPVKGGFVRFISDAGRPATGDINAEGKFSLSTFEDNDGCILGEHKVEIIGLKAGANGTWEITAPAKYHEAATSELTQRIDKAETNLQFNLTWGQEQPPAPVQATSDGDLPNI